MPSNAKKKKKVQISVSSYPGLSSSDILQGSNGSLPGGGVAVTALQNKLV